MWDKADAQPFCTVGDPDKLRVLIPVNAADLPRNPQEPGPRPGRTPGRRLPGGIHPRRPRRSDKQFTGRITRAAGHGREERAAASSRIGAAGRWRPSRAATRTSTSRWFRPTWCRSRWTTRTTTLVPGTLATAKVHLEVAVGRLVGLAEHRLRAGRRALVKPLAAAPLGGEGLKVGSASSARGEIFGAIPGTPPASLLVTSCRSPRPPASAAGSASRGIPPPSWPWTRPGQVRPDRVRRRHRLRLPGRPAAVVAVYSIRSTRRPSPAAAFLPDSKSFVTSARRHGQASGTSGRPQVPKGDGGEERRSQAGSPRSRRHDHRPFREPGHGPGRQPGRQAVATGGSDGNVKLWDADTGKVAVTLSGRPPGRRAGGRSSRPTASRWPPAGRTRRRSSGTRRRPRTSRSRCTSLTGTRGR